MPLLRIAILEWFCGIRDLTSSRCPALGDTWLNGCPRRERCLIAPGGSRRPSFRRERELTHRSALGRRERGSRKRVHQVVDGVQWLPANGRGLRCRGCWLALTVAAVDQGHDAARQVFVDAGESVDLDAEAGLLADFAAESVLDRLAEPQASTRGLEEVLLADDDETTSGRRLLALPRHRLDQRRRRSPRYRGRRPGSRVRAMEGVQDQQFQDQLVGEE